MSEGQRGQRRVVHRGRVARAGREVSRSGGGRRSGRRWRCRCGRRVDVGGGCFSPTHASGRTRCSIWQQPCLVACAFALWERWKMGPEEFFRRLAAPFHCGRLQRASASAVAVVVAVDSVFVGWRRRSHGPITKSSLAFALLTLLRSRFL